MMLNKTMFYIIRIPIEYIYYITYLICSYKFVSYLNKKIINREILFVLTVTMSVYRSYYSYYY